MIIPDAMRSSVLGKLATPPRVKIARLRFRVNVAISEYNSQNNKYINARPILCEPFTATSIVNHVFRTHNAQKKT